MNSFGINARNWETKAGRDNMCYGQADFIPAHTTNTLLPINIHLFTSAAIESVAAVYTRRPGGIYN